MPQHRYNVLEYFQVTDVWAEKSHNGFVCAKFRLEKIDLQSKGWWASMGEADPPQVRDYTIKALRKECDDCKKESPQVYEQTWTCLNHKCDSFWKADGTDLQVTHLTYDSVFKQERTQYVGSAELAPLVPPLPSPQGGQGLHVTRVNKQGIVCRNCAKCCARTDWDAWRCDNEAGCDFIYQVPRAILSFSDVVDPEKAFDGLAVSTDKASDLISVAEKRYGYFHIQKYTVLGLPRIQVTHFHSNEDINRAPGGPDDLFLALQKENIGLRRNRMTTSRSERLDYSSWSDNAKISVVANTLTNHFAKNFVSHSITPNLNRMHI